MTPIQIGLQNEIHHQVQEKHLASYWGSGLADVLATPVLVAFCEECSRLSVDKLLEPGQETVGTHINLKHLAATPPGMLVTVKSELVEVNGRRLRFQVQAWDEQELIGEAEHERFIIDAERFKQRLDQKNKLAPTG